MDEARRFVVIGGGPAGVSAAAEAARLGCEPLLLDQSGQPGGLISHAYQVRNFPGLPGAPRGSEVALSFASRLEEWGIPILRWKAVRLSGDDGLIRIEGEDGDLVLAESVVVATGTRPRTIRIPGLGDPGSVAFSAEEALSMGARGSAAVIGGSDAAFDQARFLRNEGIRVTILCRSATPRAPAWLVSAARDEGIGILCSTEVSGCTRTAGRFALQARTGGKPCVFDADSILVAAGREPSLPEGAARMLELLPDRMALAGDARGSNRRYAVAAIGDGCLAARRLLDGERGGST